MISWICKKFEDLSPYELYAAIQLRNEIFVVEQNCVFQDADNKDQYCWHLMGYNADKQLLAYTRLVPAGVSYKEPSIGRVVTAHTERGKGTGRLLMEESIKQCRILFGEQMIRIGAQLYLKKFYNSLGFKETGEIYLEDDIQHVEMLLS